MRVMVLLSGGVDSATCLGLLCKEHGADNVVTLSVAYGQKHKKELDASRALAAYYGVEHLFIDVAEVFRYSSDCSLLEHTDTAVPHGSYACQQENGDDKPVSTYVPFRNGLFLSIASSIALEKHCEKIYYGVHLDDAAGSAYPDCSEAFISAIAEAVWQGSGKQVSLEAPFAGVPKKEIVRQGLAAGVPYELTWSCYEGAEKPCGVCGTCIDRAAAFAACGVPDPAMEQQTEPE